MKLCKKVLGFTLALYLGLTTMVLAAATYPYGDYVYGTKNIPLKGDLSYSGLSGIQTRPSIVYRHDLNTQNAITGVKSPSSGNLKTVQFDIQPLPGVEPKDIFKDKSGYHLIPLEEELIKDLSAKANGNSQWVWEQISKASPHPIVKTYLVQQTPYVNIGAVFYLSGGGAPDMKRAEGDGITGPLFLTTYLTTPWPSIPILEQNSNGSLHIKALAHSIFDTAITGVVTVNGTATKQLFSKNTPVSNYTVTYEGNVPLSELPGLKQGQNQVTLTVSDKFGRTASKTIVIQNGITQGCQPVLVKMRDTTQRIYFPDVSDGSTIKYGGPLVWGMQYNSAVCSVLESVNKNNGIGDKLNQPIRVSDIHTSIFLNRWEFKIGKSKNGVILENHSKDTKPLVAYLIETKGEKVLKRYVVNKGQSVEIVLPTKKYKGEYSIQFPSPLVDSGFWAKATATRDGMPASYTYPDQVRGAIQAIVNFKK
ncbi:hypothetical protein P9302_00645 [Brevibacillus agri]|uniref:Uncharacterized protein n=1 Tax=Brevibacillus brevis TaxID=1393 RepID=A0ABY9SZB4_BREBE|nr:MULTISPECIES: hypothetical protein [Brevibacillus]MED4567994.1 hypothetical protein [Brevibacillus agri]WNC13091.1 hypothetical protein RGB73_20535 [Brevibacillus brevis]